MRMLLGVAGALCAVLMGGAAAWGQENDFLNGVVKLEVTHSNPNYSMPWQNGQSETFGSGAVITGGRVLTNAHNVADCSLITVRKNNSDGLYTATVEYVGHDCDLALLKVDDPEFFADITPFEIGETPQVQEEVFVVGYPIGGDGLSITRGIVSRIEFDNYEHSYRPLLAVQIDAAINHGNSGGPVFYGDKIGGIAFQGLNGGDGLGYMIPCEVINHFLKDVEDGKVDGFGDLGLATSNLENVGMREYLKMGKNQTGVLIYKVSDLAEKHSPNAVKVNDVLMEIEGYKVANNGNIRLANGAPCNLDYALLDKQIGDKVRLKLLRDGEVVESELPVRTPDEVCTMVYDREPDYYVLGGAVFVPFTGNLLMELGRRAPDGLIQQIYRMKSDEEDETVVLSMVLADSVNVGYRADYQTLESVNGEKVRNLRHLIELLENCSEEFAVIKFHEEHVSPMVLKLADFREATPRVLARYNIPTDRSKKYRDAE